MTIDVRCPRCNALLFKAADMRAGQIEIVCRKCREVVTWQAGGMGGRRQYGQQATASR